MMVIGSNYSTMFRPFFRALEPVRNKLARAVGGVRAAGEAGGGRAVGEAGGGRAAGEAGSAFERNSVTREEQLSSALRRALPGITYVSVSDISGGCGAMYEISVEAKEFLGISMVKQHRLVTDSLKSEIASMHGLRIHTTPSTGDT